MIEFEGVEYESICTLARAKGLLPRTLHNRLRSGHTIQSALEFSPALSLAVIRGRRNFMARLGQSCEGLCTSGIWAQWGEVLEEMAASLSAAEIAKMVGCAYPTITSDMRKFGIPVSPQGWTPYRGKKYYEEKAREEVRQLQMERCARMPEQERGAVRGLGA